MVQLEKLSLLDHCAHLSSQCVRVLEVLLDAKQPIQPVLGAPPNHHMHHRQRSSPEERNNDIMLVLSILEKRCPLTRDALFKKIVT